MNTPFLSVSAASREFGLSRSRLKRLIDSGAVREAPTSTPGCLLVARGDLEAALNRTALVDIETVRLVIREEFARIFKGVTP